MRQKHRLLSAGFGAFVLSALSLTAANRLPSLEAGWKIHDRERPLPSVVETGDNGSAPSDAIVLFDGSNLDAWVAMNGEPTKWVVNDGALECVPGSGYIRTLQSFGDCQLHIEWATPKQVKGNSQGRGNSGVFMGLTRYETQVLDSYENKTYADGSAGSIYGQYPPLVNASKGPGEWQTYDLIYTAPRFDDAGALLSPAKITLLHNGVLIQHESELVGPAVWIGKPPYDAHPTKLPIAMQDHGNPVRYRNIWIRELDTKSPAEFYLPDATLDAYVGTYDNGGNWGIKVERIDNGMLQLDAVGGQKVKLSASSMNSFFDKITDIQVKFETEDGEEKLKLSVGSNWGSYSKVKE